MTSIAVYVTINDEFLAVFATICDTVPCWTDLGIDDDFVHIVCREEDASYVERMLAPFV